MKLTNEILDTIQQLVDNNKDNEALQFALSELNLALHAYEAQVQDLQEEVKHLTHATTLAIDMIAERSVEINMVAKGQYTLYAGCDCLYFTPPFESEGYSKALRNCVEAMKATKDQALQVHFYFPQIHATLICRPYAHSLSLL